MTQIKQWNRWRADNPRKSINLEGANLGGANLSSADLERASLSSANLISADLEGANLERANLISANLERASLEGANLSSADLERASLERANLERANLEGANLERANLERANLEGANLSSATGLLSASAWMEKHFSREENNDGYIVYKAAGETYFSAPPSWRIETNAIIKEVPNPCRTTSCGSGVNFGTARWVLLAYENSRVTVWRCLLAWSDLPDVVVPYNTDGKARCARLKLLEEITLQELAAVVDTELRQPLQEEHT